MKTLYFDCFAGVSGNMILGAMISLGVDPLRLKKEIEKLNISDFELEVDPVNRAGIGAVHIRTVYEEEHRHRRLSDIVNVVSNSGLSRAVKKRSIEVFERLATAEANVHGTSVETVHFHEVGAMDAIIDVVGACVCFDFLGIERFQCSKIHTGTGFIEISHGRYPVPPPAVTSLLKGFPVYSTDIEGELATPTGAAIVSTVCADFNGMPEMIIEATGYGAGSRAYDRFPNVLRVIIGETNNANAVEAERLILLETNLDDTTGETLGFLMERSLELGALDCWFAPIQMKKNRPGHTVSLLCRDPDREKLSNLLYTESSAIGLRIRHVERECLRRSLEKVETRFGAVGVKVATLNGRVVNVKPEFDELVFLAETAGVELKRLTAEVAELCAKHYEGARIVGKQASGGSR